MNDIKNKMLFSTEGLYKINGRKNGGLYGSFNRDN